MSSYPALKGLRIGCVRYLNSKPLIHGLAGVRLEHPSVLAEALREGALDVALVPVFELLRAPLKYRVVDGVSIASRGAVYSVFVAYQGRLEDVDAVLVDPASLTSVHLVQILFKKVLGRSVELVNQSETAGVSHNAARLLIGNQAISFRQNAGQDWSYWDLGEVWTQWTGMPFVYAVWVMGRDVSFQKEVSEAFRMTAKEGVSQIAAIASGESEVTPKLAYDYLTKHICYALGEMEKPGLERFREELCEMKFVSDASSLIEFV